MSAHITTPDQRQAFALAKLFKIPWGKYRGRTIDSVAQDDDGLLYLGWLRGQIDAGAFGAQADLRGPLATYLDDPSIAADLAKLARARK